MAQTTLLPRSEFSEEQKWNAVSVFESPDAWAAEYDAVMALLPEVEKHKGHLGESAAALADGLLLIEEFVRRTLIVYVYGVMSQAVDTTDQQAAEMASKAGGLLGRMNAAIAFSDPEMLSIGRETLEGWIEEEPRLAHYRHYVDNLFRKQAHVRSPEVEEVLGLASVPFFAVRTTYDLLVNADMTFAPAASSSGEKADVGQSTMPALRSDPDRELRRSAWESYASGYLTHKNTLASNLDAIVRRDVFYARARHYDSSLEAALFEDNIPVEVFHNLLETFRENIPTWHRYWAVKRKALGLDAIYPYDIWAPLVDDPPTVPFEQAVEWISAGMAPLGDEYVEVLRRGCLEQQWIDRTPNIGKQQGAFSFGSQGTYPFIKMSYVDKVGSMSTLAHELGHSMHSYLTWQNQPMIYSPYSLFVAEVASNFNQAMVRAYLLENSDDPALQVSLIEEAMSNFHRYFFIMPTLARFEMEIHARAERGEGLTADAMIELMADLFAEGYGDQMSYDRELVGITWAQFQHMYRSFYVYQYATGIAGAHALANRVLSGKAGAAEDYLGFLKAGSSVYALDALKMAGVDLSTPQPVRETFEVLAGYIDRLEALTG